MNMKKKMKPQKMVAYDFSNLDLQENSTGNCFASDCEDTCVCDCDCDDGCNDNCDVDGYCDF